MKKWFLIAVAVLLISAGLSYYIVFQAPAFAHTHVEKKVDLRIPQDADLGVLLDSLEELGLKHAQLFSLLSDRMNYNDRTMKTGLFEIDRTWNMIDLIRHLRSGRQKPVMVTFNNVRTLEQLAGKITTDLQLDSLKFLTYIDSTFSQKERQRLMTYFIPDSYQVFWNISAAKLIERMRIESDRFWESEERYAKAEKLGMSPEEVYTLASIVEQESTLESEKPDIASVYLNRIHRGMKLQADPTVVFAVGDFGIRRVLNKHLVIDSPYNTYLYPGLPPGPICMPSKSSIDACLEPSDTDYIFFCAKPGYQNGHAFASTLRGHNNNARKYREWLSSEGIR